MRRLGLWLFVAILASTGVAQDHFEANATGAIHLQIVSSLPGRHHAVPAVVWLEPIPPTPTTPFEPHGHYTLIQKDRTFRPHLQVIPVGSMVQFPNEDPFFHNVFSLFDGKKFDLGLYEAGSSKSQTFSRKGVSYIFCNIHPEMSAIIIALDTTLYAIADAQDGIVFGHIPPGDYTLNVWIEGVPLSILGGLARPLHVSSHVIDLGEIRAPIADAAPMEHEDMYGRPYPRETQSPY